MISKFHIIHICIEIKPKKYKFLSFYLYWKFHFKHRKNIQQKNTKILRIKKKKIFKSIDLIQPIPCIHYVLYNLFDVPTNCKPREYHCQSLIWYLYTFAPANPWYDYAIVVCIHHILSTNQHLDKDFVRT